jgi:hypothetical protein
LQALIAFYFFLLPPACLQENINMMHLLSVWPEFQKKKKHLADGVFVIKHNDGHQRSQWSNGQTLFEESRVTM